MKEQRRPRITPLGITEESVISETPIRPLPTLGSSDLRNITVAIAKEWDKLTSDIDVRTYRVGGKLLADSKLRHDLEHWAKTYKLTTVTRVLGDAVMGVDILLCRSQLDINRHPIPGTSAST